MKIRLLAASLTALWALPASAQDDRVVLANGTKIDGVKVTGFDIRELRYSKGSSNESVPADQVAKVELGKFRDVYARGIRNADLMLTVAREQLQEKSDVMAQLGFVGASAQFFDTDRPQEAVGCLDELQKALPEAGVVAEVFRQKFEYYMSLGGKGAQNAATVAKKYQSAAVGGAWPSGFAVESEFFLALAERAAGGNPAEYQTKLRSVIGKAGGTNPVIMNRANVELAHSLREAKDKEGARRIYEDIAQRDGVDDSSRAGAFVGLGMLLLDEATPENRDAARKALLMFLRVRLETREAWPSLQAEALYHAILAADKWRGSEYQMIMARCRGVLFSEFAGSEWEQRAKAGR
jgi:hypothetical protein